MNSLMSMTSEALTTSGNPLLKSALGPRESSPVRVDGQEKRLEPEDLQADPLGINSLEDGHDIPAGNI